MKIDIRKLTNFQAIYMLRDTASKFFDGIDIEFVTNNSSFQKENCLVDISCECGSGDTVSSINDVEVVYIGASEIYDANPDSNVDVNCFVKTLVAMHHEKEHVNQIVNDCYLDNNTVKSVALSSYSAYCYPEYHKRTYFHQPNEIQAEYYGVLNGYKQLLNLTRDPELSNQLICEYTNDRYDNNVSFLSRNDYTDVKDIFSDFRELFKKECRKHKDFNAEECIVNSDADKSLLKLIQNTQNGNVQNAIAVRQLLSHFERQGKDSNNWDNYNRFTALPVIKALDLESSKLKNRIRSYFTLYPEGLDIKQVSIGDENYEREIVDFAEKLESGLERGD